MGTAKRESESNFTGRVKDDLAGLNTFVTGLVDEVARFGKETG